ncbi:3'-5' exonuclease [Leeia oryzae]|uniref:3'-5' exonuclease n=1 Tax=Leeia oryzae TaxID=356662 RepID=UPI00036393CB|nr:3'-5' exonuclease [Leeia oryzae]
MSLFGWFKSRGAAVSLTDAQLQALAAWREQDHALNLQKDWRQVRWVATDLETSGLNIKTDKVLAIGSVQGNGTDIQPADSFECILQQTDTSSAENILLHGITATDQLNGMNAADGLLSYLQYSSGAFHIGFHAEFDRMMLMNACKRIVGIHLQQRWLDLAWLAPALCPELAGKCKSLDDWLHAFGIEGFSRHHAVSDAWATGLLWLTLQMKLPSQCVRVQDVLDLAAKQRAVTRFYTS